MKKHPGCLGGYPYPLLEGLYPITPWDPYMIYIYLHLSRKSSAKYTSSMDPMGYRNPGIPIFNSQ